MMNGAKKSDSSIVPAKLAKTTWWSEIAATLARGSGLPPA